jgi:hypothetical protein
MKFTDSVLEKTGLYGTRLPIPRWARCLLALQEVVIGRAVWCWAEAGVLLPWGRGEKLEVPSVHVPNTSAPALGQSSLVLIVVFLWFFSPRFLTPCLGGASLSLGMPSSSTGEYILLAHGILPGLSPTQSCCFPLAFLASPSTCTVQLYNDSLWCKGV